ncbi:MAG: hypothetical protein FJZ16_09870 [Candidatus Omnitrophica bacterium]|nr:hypothetical protein [Candidatus Omnitrophota bacterium]
MKASAGLNPLVPYLKAISKGTTKSSSIVVNALMKLMNSRKDSGDKLRLTSSNIVGEYGQCVNALFQAVSLKI